MHIVDKGDGWSVEGTTLHSVLSRPVLLLNRSYLPVRISTARRSLVLLYGGRAKALDEHYEAHDFDSWLDLPHSVLPSLATRRGRMRVPEILLLVHYDRVPRSPLRLSRRNVFLRDDYTCQYCGRRHAVRELNLDHVTPRCRGGATSWENLVTSCRPCNLVKADRLPDECGMRPRLQPRRPTWSLVAQIAAVQHRAASWDPFLGSSVHRLDAQAGGRESSGCVAPRGRGW